MTWMKGWRNRQKQKLPLLSSWESIPSVSNKKKAIQEEERLLGNIANRGEESIAFQTKDLEMLAPLNSTQSSAYADWTKEEKKAKKA